jgi:shikimate kinase
MNNIILIGMKACGKSTVGKLLAQKLEIEFIELDIEVEKAHLLSKKESLNFREIFKKHGGDYFRKLESEVLKDIFQEKNAKKFILSCGGGTPLNDNNQKILKSLGNVIFLDAEKIILLPRILKHGIPVFFPFQNDPEKSLDELLKKRKPVYEKTADKTISFNKETPEEIANKIISLLK